MNSKPVPRKLLAPLAALVLLAAASAPLRAGTVYFLASEYGTPAHGDSFVVPLTEPTHIEHARDLIRHGRSIGGYLIAADIVAGADNINRNILAEGKPAWSWHVSEVDAFGDVSIELTDGWPTFIEQDVQGWIENTDGVADGEPSTGVGRIAFWNYTITAELTGPPTDLEILPASIPLPAAAVPGAMTLLGVAGWQWTRRR